MEHQATLRKAALRKVRYLLGFFVIALTVSGLTAIPLKLEVSTLQALIGEGTFMASIWPGLSRWVSFVHRGLTESYDKYPFIAYGTDWLAFGHFVIAIAFLGALRDPVRNLWVIEFGMIACVLVIPMALIFGPIRGIPLLWRLIDTSFGIFGIIPLWISRKYVLRVIELKRERHGPV